MNEERGCASGQTLVGRNAAQPSLLLLAASERRLYIVRPRRTEPIPEGSKAGGEGGVDLGRAIVPILLC